VVFELLDGPSLREHLQAHGPMPCGEVPTRLAALFDAVAYMHGWGVVHRDFKPGNVHFGATVKVLDLGSAKANDEALFTFDGLERTTGTNVPMTLEYRSPESFGEVPIFDQHADLWAVAVLRLERPSPPRDARSGEHRVDDLDRRAYGDGRALPSTRRRTSDRSSHPPAPTTTEPPERFRHGEAAPPKTSPAGASHPPRDGAAPPAPTASTTARSAARPSPLHGPQRPLLTRRWRLESGVARASSRRPLGRCPWTLFAYTPPP